MIIGGIITGSIMVTAGTVMRGMEVNSAIDMAVQLEPPWVTSPFPSWGSASSPPASPPR